MGINTAKIPADLIVEERIGVIPYRSDIDGLRGFAVLAVVLYHAFPDIARGGYIGVDVFFVISGYLISGIIFSSLQGGGFSFFDFYARRIRRLFPALFFVLASCLAVGWVVLLPAQYAQLGKHTAGAAGFVVNFIFNNESGYFDIKSEAKLLLHLWSLGIEEQFYFIWPGLVVLFWNSKKFFPWMIAVAAFASFISNVSTISIDPSADFFLPQNRFWELLAGSLLAYIMKGGREIFSEKDRNTASLIAIALLGISVFALHRHVGFPGWFAIFPVVSSCLLIAVGKRATVNSAILSTPILLWFGSISYPLYLWHWVLLSFANVTDFGDPGISLKILCLVFAVVLAWGTYEFVERPIRFGPRHPFIIALLCAGMMVVGVTGFSIYMDHGVRGRTILPFSDQRSFVRSYDAEMLSAVGRYWHDECNFNDWKNKKIKTSISPSCTNVTGPVAFIWGDSHAQALSLGIRNSLPAGFSAVQITSSGCAPRLSDLHWGGNALKCNRSNAAARKFVKKHHPEIVILVQAKDHEKTRWNDIAKFLRDAGAKKIFVIGPVPQWEPSLPMIVAREFWGKPHDVILEGLKKKSLETDRKMKVLYANSPLFEYVSIIERLCSPIGCRAEVQYKGKSDLLVMDYGHLSPTGSKFIGRAILKSEFSGVDHH